MHGNIVTIRGAFLILIMQSLATGFLSYPKNRYMAILILLTTIGFNVMRGMREAIVFQFGQNGAMYTPFIRILCVLPISTLLFLFYLSVKKRHNSLVAYYAMTIPMLCYFIGYYLLASQQVIDPTQLPEWIRTAKSFYAPLEFICVIFYHWDKTLYYVCCEAWGSFTLVILFWQIANENYSRQEASSYYPVLSMLGGIGIILASVIIEQMGRAENMMAMTTQCIASIGLCNLWLVNRVWQCQQKKQLLQKKTPVSLIDGLKHAISSPHILYLATCIISFSILCNVYENAVRNIVLHYYSDEKAVFQFWGTFFLGKGLLVITGNIISRMLLRKLGWFYVAIATPIITIFSIHVVLLIPSIQQFSTLMAGSQSMLWLLAILLQITYAVKYSFFDPTKEMAYIPLPESERTYGKTVADGLGSRVGNVGSGFIQTIAIVITSGIEFSEIATALLFMCSLVSLSWALAMRGLNRSYHSLIKQEEQSARFIKPANDGVRD